MQSDMPDEWESVRVVVDENTLANTNDPMVVIDPVWWIADFYEDRATYEASLAPFSRSQRIVYAVLWYDHEVCNGGHHQFYSNSTGMVWLDALTGFEAMEIASAREILSESADRLGAPSLNRAERNRQLKNVNPTFDDLDDRYYAFKRDIVFDKRIMTFIRSQPHEFYFSGDVRKPKR